MTHDDPYAPPNSVVGNPEEIVRPTKRPASHKWVIFIFTLMTAGFAWFFVARRTFHWYGLLLGPAMLAALGGMFFRKHSRATFYSVSVTLGAFVLYCIWTTYVIGQIAFRQGGIAMETFAGQVGFGALLLLLLYRFTFGRASREYYGFPVSPKSK